MVGVVLVGVADGRGGEWRRGREGTEGVGAAPGAFCDLPRLRVGAIDGVTPATILETLRALGDTPVLLEGALDAHWARALGEWRDAAYFRTRFGHVHVPKQALVNKTLDVVEINHSALLADMTISSAERARANMYSSICASIGSMSSFFAHTFWAPEHLGCCLHSHRPTHQHD